MTLLGAVAQARPRAVHGGVPAADDDHVLADLERLAQVGLLHELDAVLDARRGPCPARPTAPGPWRPRMIAIASNCSWSCSKVMSRPMRVLKRKVTPRRSTRRNVHLDRLAREAEGRHADEHRAAGVGQLVEDGHLVAGDGQLARHGDARRAGADHRDAGVARRDPRHVVGDAGGRVPLHEEPLHGADGQRPVDVTAAAGTLAGRGTDVGAHRGHGVGLPGQDVALLEPPFGGEVQVAAAVRADRDRLPGTRCCTGARRRRRAEPGIPGSDRWPNSRNVRPLGRHGLGALPGRQNLASRGVARRE